MYSGRLIAFSELEHSLVFSVRPPLAKLQQSPLLGQRRFRLLPELESASTSGVSDDLSSVWSALEEEDDHDETEGEALQNILLSQSSKALDAGASDDLALPQVATSGFAGRSSAEHKAPSVDVAAQTRQDRRRSLELADGTDECAGLEGLVDDRGEKKTGWQPIHRRRRDHCSASNSSTSK